MSQFVYNTSPNPNRNQIPIFPDWDPQSPMSIKMHNAKNNEGDNFWETMREVFKHDFETLPKDRFKMWASVWAVPFVTRRKFAYNTAVAMSAAIQDPVYASALVEPIIGCTRDDFTKYLSVFDDFDTTNTRLLHMSYLIDCGYTRQQLEKMDTIVELGAGLGEMCDIIHKLGFKGKYIIFDLPEVSAMQKWYHDKLGYKNITYTSDISDLPVDSDLCVATWSLTEMPIDLRNNIIEQIKDTKNWLVGYSTQIFNINNKDWIDSTLLSVVGNKKVETINIPHMPWHGGSFYLTIKS